MSSASRMSQFRINQSLGPDDLIGRLWPILVYRAATYSYSAANQPKRQRTPGLDPLLPLKQSIRDVRFWESLATRHAVIRDLTAAGTLRPKTAESCEKRNRYSGSPASPSAPMYSSFLSGCFWGEASARCLAYSAKLNVGSSSRTSLT